MVAATRRKMVSGDPGTTFPVTTSLYRPITYDRHSPALPGRDAGLLAASAMLTPEGYLQNFRDATPARGTAVATA